MRAGAKRETAAGGQVELARVAADLGHHGGKAAAAQPLLEDPERVAGFPDADDDQAGRRQTEAAEAGGKEKSGFMGGGGFDNP